VRPADRLDRRTLSGLLDSRPMQGAYRVPSALLVHRLRARPGSAGRMLLVALGAALVGVWLGLDLQGSPLHRAETLFTLVLAASAPLPLVALGCLYHDHLHFATLPWPVSPAQHWVLGLRLFAAGQWPWFVLLGATCIASMRPFGAETIIVALLFSGFGLLGSTLFALGAAGLCAGLSAANGPLAGRIRGSLAGPFATQRHAPFFYLPALGYGLGALASGLVHEAILVPLLQSSPAAAISAPTLVGLSLPAMVGLVLFALGTLSYLRHALHVIPRVHEEARMVYGGKPAPADPPYGLSFALLLPRGARPHYRKELREQGRAQRSLWGVVALGLFFALFYGVGTGTPARSAPVLALLLVVWSATLPTRRTRRELAAGLLPTLPHSPRASWLGRWNALHFVVLHLTLPFAASLWLRGQGPAAVVIVLTGAAGSAAAAAATQPLRRVNPGLVAATTLACGLSALAWFPYGLTGLVALTAYAFWIGLKP
jgi:hypothetical protein